MNDKTQTPSTTPTGAASALTDVLGVVPFKIIKARQLYATEKGVQFGDYSFGPHSTWSISIETDDRDTLVKQFRAWIHSIGGGVSSHGYDPKAPIVNFGVTLPTPNV